jgi:hypothetical protein
LHIVVCIAEHGRFACGVQPIGVYQGMALGRYDFYILEADALKLVGYEFGGLLDIALMFFKSADTGDA